MMAMLRLGAMVIAVWLMVLPQAVSAQEATLQITTWNCPTSVTEDDTVWVEGTDEGPDTKDCDKAETRYLVFVDNTDGQGTRDQVIATTGDHYYEIDTEILGESIALEPGSYAIADDNSTAWGHFKIEDGKVTDLHVVRVVDDQGTILHPPGSEPDAGTPTT